MTRLDTVELLKKLISFDSISGDEVELTSWVSDYLNQLGLETIVSGRNVYTTLEGSAEGKTLLLNTHIDVVPPGDAWTTDPFKAVVKGDLLYGRGSSDAKGCAASMINAVLNMAENPPEGKVILALTCDEETGGEGLEKLIHELPECDSAIIGEPTQNHVALGMRGLVSLRLTSKGEGCHAARPHEGHNPIYALARDLNRVGSFNPDPEDEVLGKPTIATTVVTAGNFEARNRVPDEATAIVDIRTIPAWDNDVAIEELSGVIQETEIEVRSKRIRPKVADRNSAIAKYAKEATGNDWYSNQVGSDLVFVPCPGIILGPGNSTSHQVDENISVRLLKKSVDIYEQATRLYLKS